MKIWRWLNLSQAITTVCRWKSFVITSVPTLRTLPPSITKPVQLLNSNRLGLWKSRSKINLQSMLRICRKRIRKIVEKCPKKINVKHMRTTFKYLINCMRKWDWTGHTSLKALSTSWFVTLALIGPTPAFSSKTNISVTQTVFTIV